MLEADLRRPQHVARRVERHLHAIDGERFAEPERVDRHAAADPLAEHEFAGRRAEIAVAAGPRMIGVGMRDDRPGHPPPGIDVEITLPAIEPLGREFEQVWHRVGPRGGRDGGRTKTFSVACRGPAGLSADQR